jgi:hypothetical protein
MISSQKDSVGQYIVNIDTKACTPFSFRRPQKELDKNAAVQRIIELEKKQVELESLLAEKNTSHESEVHELNDRYRLEMDTMRNMNKSLNVNINEKIVKIESLTADLKHAKENNKELKIYLRAAEREKNDLGTHLYVLKTSIENYLSSDINHEKLQDTMKYMTKRMSEIKVPDNYDILRAIENVWDNINVAKRQQLQEEAKRQQLQ